MTRMYFKKSKVQREIPIFFFNVLKQLRGLWSVFPQKQTLRLGFECKIFFWELILGIPGVGGGAWEETQVW